jgi:hypothetical protein
MMFTILLLYLDQGYEMVTYECCKYVVQTPTSMGSGPFSIERNQERNYSGKHGAIGTVAQSNWLPHTQASRELSPAWGVRGAEEREIKRGDRTGMVEERSKGGLNAWKQVSSHGGCCRAWQAAG